MRYDEQARDAGIYLVSACGFDCIPNDMGALLLQKSFNGELAYMESYMSVSKGVSKGRQAVRWGVWLQAVLKMADTSSLWTKKQ